MAQGNIVGEPFDDYVYNQITARQKLHGSFNRTQSQLNYLNSKTGWVKLTSGVIVNSEGQKRLNKLGISGPGLTGADGLNSRFVLFGGTYQDSATYGKKMFEGLSTGDSVLNTNAYGLGGLEQGYRPMPGITSAETKFRNRGAIRDGSVNIKVWNRKQLEIIDILYLRLGFPMLLEWGHSIVIDSSGNVNANPNYSISSEFSKRAYQKDNDVLKALEKKREESGGNYDGMYGRVQNFSFSYNKDGSYDVDLKLISIGAVVESLKANVKVGTKENPTEDTSKSTEEELNNDWEWITAHRYSHYIGNEFFKYYQELDGNVDFLANSSRYDGDGFQLTKTIYATIVGLITDNGFRLNKAGRYLSLSTDQTQVYYVKFGWLRFLLQNIVPIDSKTREPVLKIVKFNKDNKIDLDEPIPMYTHNSQLSGDLRICLVGGFNIAPHPFFDNKLNPDKAPLEIYPFLNDSTTSFKYLAQDNKTLIGNLNNVYVNMGFVLKKMSELKNEKNELTLIDLIQTILDSINSALGGINTLSVNIIENTNELQFVDETPLPKGVYPDEENKYDNSPALLVQGYYDNGTQAGFIKDISIKTEISNQLASLITIGATANGSIVGEDATAFSKWNEGLEPIIKEKLQYPTETNSNDFPPKPQDLDTLFKENEPLINRFFKWFSEEVKWKDSFDNYNLNEGDSSSEMYSKYLQLVIQYETLQKEIQNKKKPVNPTSSKGFFPLNVSVTMDGLAGVKIYQKLKIDASFLPSNYPDVLDFIIKGVTHKIENNTWNTTIETVSVPKIEATDVTSDVGRGNVTATGIPTPTQTAPSPSTNTAESRPQGRNTTNTANTYVNNTDCKSYLKRSPGLTEIDTQGTPIRWLKATNYDICQPNKSFTTSEYKKTSVVIHHTAGWAKYSPQYSGEFGGVGWWGWCAVNGTPINGKPNFRWAPGAPYVLNGLGEILRMPNDKASYNTTGGDANAFGIGIEIDNVGALRRDNVKGVFKHYSYGIGQYIEDAEGPKKYFMNKGWNNRMVSLGDGISAMTDWNLKPLCDRKDYKNSTYCKDSAGRETGYAQEYSPAQIKALEAWIHEMFQKHGMKPFVWEGENTFRRVFPIQPNYEKNLSIITHRCWANIKNDSMPTLELVKLLIRVGRK